MKTPRSEQMTRVVDTVASQMGEMAKAAKQEMPMLEATLVRRAKLPLWEQIDAPVAIIQPSSRRLLTVGNNRRSNIVFPLCALFQAVVVEMKLLFPIRSRGLLLAIGLGIGGIACVSHIAGAANAEGPFLALNETAMNKMMAGMAVRPTGDADHDFVAMMVPHHQGAIDMAQAELEYGHNQKLLRIAQEIVVEQLQEIAAMRLAIGEPASPTWVTNGANEAQALAPLKATPGSDAAFVSRSNAAMDKMMTDMAIKPTGEVDHDFVAMMVPHHQGAIDMAQAELQYGQNPQLRTIAQEIIVDQMQEITLMRLALGEPLPQSVPSPTQSPSGAMKAAPANESDASQTPMRMSPAMQMAPTRPAGAH